jgi:hypothetical protein
VIWTSFVSRLHKIVLLEESLLIVRTMGGCLCALRVLALAKENPLEI